MINSDLAALMLGIFLACAVTYGIIETIRIHRSHKAYRKKLDEWYEREIRHIERLMESEDEDDR